MAQISLQEQMGAMAIIDELRHAKMEVQKHLDLPARRQAVAERIRSHYAAKGISFDDALVEEGVKQFFASRLTFESATPGRLERALAVIFITRKKWAFPATLVVALGVIGVIGGNYAAARYTAYQLASFDDAVQEVAQRRASALNALQALAERSVIIGNAEPDTAPARLLVDQVRQEVRSVAKTAEALSLPAQAATATPVTSPTELDLAIEQIKAVPRSVQSENEHLAKAERLIDANRVLAGLTSAADSQPAGRSALERKAHALAIQALATDIIITVDAITLPAHVTQETRAKSQADLDVAEDQIKAVTQAVLQGNKLLTEAETFLDANRRLASLTSAPDFPQALSLPLVSKAHTQANLAMASDSRTGSQHAASSVKELATAVTKYRAIQPLKGQLMQLQQAVASMKMSDTDNAQFAPLYSRVNDEIQALNLPSAEAALRDLIALKDFAAQRLDLHVVSRANQKSMVERNYDATGGKTWYLLTEATDAAGNVIPVPVVSSETGRKTMAKVFGVRVSEAQYRAAYADKKADGHVDDAAMGFKAANTLTATFERAVIGKPDILTDW